jgi:hypothetical protein
LHKKPLRIIAAAFLIFGCHGAVPGAVLTALILEHKSGVTIFVFLFPHGYDLIDRYVASFALMILQLQNAATDANAFAPQAGRAGTDDINFLAD